jgi:hypothetical protein
MGLSLVSNCVDFRLGLFRSLASAQDVRADNDRSKMRQEATKLGNDTTSFATLVLQTIRPLLLDLESLVHTVR